QPRRKRPLGHDHAVELEHRIARRVDERERPRDALAVDIQRDAHELAGLKTKRRPFDSERKQRLGPVAVLDHPAAEPLLAHEALIALIASLIATYRARDAYRPPRRPA